MEEIESELRKSELKQRKARKLWKELNEELDSTREGLRTRIRELVTRGEEIGLREKALESKELRFDDESVRDLNDLIEEYREELGEKEKDFEKFGELVREKERELDSVRNRVEERCEEVKRYDDEIAAKKRELDAVKKAVMECERSVDLKGKVLGEMEEKVTEFCLVKKSVEDLACRVEGRKREVDGWVSVLEAREKDVEERVEEFRLIVERVSEWIDEARVEDERLVSGEKAIQEQELHLCSLRKLVLELEVKLDLLSQELKRKERLLEEVELKMAKVGRNVPSDLSDAYRSHWDGRGLQMLMYEPVKRMYAMAGEVSEVLKASSEPAKLVLDAMQEFYPSSSTLHNKETHLDLTVIRRSCIILLEELKKMSPQINAPVKNEAIKLVADWLNKITVSHENIQEILGILRFVDAYGLSWMYDGKRLQSLLAVVQKPEQASQSSRDLGIKDNAPGTNIISSLIKTEEPESSLAMNATTLSFPIPISQNEMLSSLLLVSDPAGDVVKSVRRSLFQYWTNEDVSVKEHIMLNNMSLFKYVTALSPHIGPHVKEDAKHLAACWKAEMIGNSESSVETLGFLLFVSTYGLVSTLNTEETINFLGVISRNEQALDLCEKHGFADKIADFIRNLIESKQLLDAVGFICTFNLVDKFPPTPLLKQYVEEAKKCLDGCSLMKLHDEKVPWLFLKQYVEEAKKCLDECSIMKLHDEKVKIADNLLCELRAAIQCIKKYNLESEYPYAGIELDIAQLEFLLENWKRPAPSLGSNIVEPERRRKRQKSEKTDNTSSTRAFPSKQ